MHQSSVKPRMVPSPSSMHHQNLVALRASCYPCTFPSISLASCRKNLRLSARKSNHASELTILYKMMKMGFIFGWFLGDWIDWISQYFPGDHPNGGTNVHNRKKPGWILPYPWVDSKILGIGSTSKKTQSHELFSISSRGSRKPTKEQFLATPVRDPEHNLGWMG